MTDIRNIDLNLLVALDALLEERSVTRAAARLSLTQPTVSGMLARLRRALADPLFVRTSHGLLPTPHAAALAVPVKRLLAEARAIMAPAGFDPATAERTFVLSTTDYVQQAIVCPFVADARRAAPGLRFALRPLAIADLSARLADGEVDLALTIPEFAPPDLKARRLYREQYVGVVGRQHPIRDACVSIEEFCRFDHVLVSPAGGGFRGPVDETLAGIGRSRRVAVSVPSFLVVPSLLHATDLIAVLPRRMVREQDGLRTFALPVDVPGFDVIAVWHARVHGDPGHRWLRDRLAAATRAAPGFTPEAA